VLDEDAGLHFRVLAEADHEASTITRPYRATS
jgi:hypothetical protein